MRRLDPIYMLLMGFLLGLLCLPAFAAVDKADGINHIKTLKESFAGDLDRLDRDIMALIQFSPDDKSDSLRARENELLIKKEKRTDLSLKVEFLDQLIYQFERYYSGQPIRPFMLNRLSVMLAREFGLGSTKIDSRENMIRYITRIRYGLTQSKAEGRKVFDFLEGQLKSSSLLSPEKLDPFVTRDSYSNGIEQRTVKGASLEEAGDYVDKVIKKEKKSEKKREIKSEDSTTNKLPTQGQNFVPNKRFAREHLIAPQKSYWKEALKQRASSQNKDQLL